MREDSAEYRDPITRMAGAAPSLAQLYASIATSEATHATALTSRISQGLASS